MTLVVTVLVATFALVTLKYFHGKYGSNHDS